MKGENMGLKALENKITELAKNCVSKYETDCIEINDSVLIAWIIPQLELNELNVFYWNQNHLLTLFRIKAKEALDSLNK